MTPNPAPSIYPGAKVDKFEILEQIGSGPMSVVWKGYDRLLARFVVLKQLLPGNTSGGGDEDWRRRLGVLAELYKRVPQDHRHLVRVMDVLIDPQGAIGFFILMEFIDGPSLEQFLAAQAVAFDERRALGMVGAAAMALEVIHGQSVAHGDLKPSNILLPRQGGLKVTDLGLGTLMTQQDILTLGTARYMAPELLAGGGAGGAADQRTDIYALGMIAYEMLAGRAGFDEAFKSITRDPRGQSARWLKWHTNPRSKAPPLTQINPLVSPALDQLVANMMAKDPARRIASAGELLTAIRGHLNAESPVVPVPAKPQASTAPVQRSAAPPSAALPSVGSHAVATVLPPDAPIAGATKVGANDAPVVPVRSTDSTPPVEPRPRYSRRTKFLLASLVVELILVAAGVYTTQHIRHKNDHYYAVAGYNAAMDEYQAQSFAEAASDFQKVANSWPRLLDVATKSRAMALLSEASLSVENADYVRALAQVNEADDLGAFSGHREQFQAIKDRAIHGAAFAKAVAEIKSQIDRGNLHDAMASIGKTANLDLAPEQSGQVDQLKLIISKRQDKLRNDLKTAQVLDEAKRLVLADHRDRAIALLEDAFKQYQDPRLREYARQLLRKINYERAMAQGKAAEKSAGPPGSPENPRNPENLKAAIAAYQQADGLVPDKGLETYIQSLRGLEALAEGRRLLEQGDKAGAAAAFARSIAAKDTPQAREALKELKAQRNKDAYVGAGDESMDAKDYAGAIEDYENALVPGPDADLSRKLGLAKALNEIKKGDAALAAGKPDEAATALQAGRDLQLDEAKIKQALDDLDHRIKYRAHLEAGDELRQKKQFGEAAIEYRKARELLPTPEINQRIDDTEYDHLIAQTRAFMDSRQWASAKAEAASAMQIHATDEVKRLQMEIETHLEGGSEGKAP